MLRRLLSEESGVVLSAELVLVVTVTVLASIVGLSEVAVAVSIELNDLSNAIGALDQSISYTGFTSDKSVGNEKNVVAGGIFFDETDDCDANTTCDIVCGTGDDGVLIIGKG